ncbi:MULTISPECIES: hypothetical protein [unclassified Vibrio]|uniref:hypothetical protein n=1 Tax=Vibrio TaxID=662 RepID=UPI00198114BC|nr:MULTISPECIES: hypothetical protein [unclassified Vibrio]
MRHTTNIGMRLVITILHFVLYGGVKFRKAQIWIHSQHGFNIIKYLGVELGRAESVTRSKCRI